MTAPCAIRSIALPRAPPIINPRPTAGSADRDRNSHKVSKPVTAKVSATSAICPEAESRANKLNEMPRFHRSVKIKERRERPRIDIGSRGIGQNASFDDLVDEDDGERDHAAHRGRLHGKRPSSLSSRSACASRGVTSGKSGEAVAGSK